MLKRAGITKAVLVIDEAQDMDDKEFSLIESFNGTERGYAGNCSR